MYYDFYELGIDICILLFILDYAISTVDEISNKSEQVALIE